MKRSRARRRILDAKAQRSREQLIERGPIPDRAPLRASIHEHYMAKLGRLVERLNAG